MFSPVKIGGDVGGYPMITMLAVPLGLTLLTNIVECATHKKLFSTPALPEKGSSGKEELFTTLYSGYSLAKKVWDWTPGKIKYPIATIAALTVLQSWKNQGKQAPITVVLDPRWTINITPNTKQTENESAK